MACIVTSGDGASFVAVLEGLRRAGREWWSVEVAGEDIVDDVGVDESCVSDCRDIMGGNGDDDDNERARVCVMRLVPRRLRCNATRFMRCVRLAHGRDGGPITRVETSKNANDGTNTIDECENKA